MNINSHFIISSESFKYVVTPSPNPNSVEYYKDLFSTNGVTTVVRLCEEKKYDDSILKEHGISVIDVPIPDGSVPNDEAIKNWKNIIMAEMKKNNNAIAVHCMSGLGRAPLFVCVGLITLDNIEPLDAITKVRKEIPGALNSRQLDYVSTIKITKRRRCCIM
jgi:protein tyrosine phosphatase type 4A